MVRKVVNYLGNKEDKMIEAQKAYSEEKVKLLKEVVDMMIANGEAVTPYSVYKKSGLSKAFVYTNGEAKAYIDQHRSEKQYNIRKLTTQDVMAERIAELEKENAKLRKELRYYKQASLETLLNENQLLKYRLQKFEELVNQGLIKLPENIETEE